MNEERQGSLLWKGFWRFSFLYVTQKTPINDKTDDFLVI
jgi:hypothetical protein